MLSLRNLPNYKKLMVCQGNTILQPSHHIEKEKVDIIDKAYLRQPFGGISNNIGKGIFPFREKRCLLK